MKRACAVLAVILLIGAALSHEPDDGACINRAMTYIECRLLPLYNDAGPAPGE